MEKQLPTHSRGSPVASVAPRAGASEGLLQTPQSLDRDFEMFR